MTPSPKEGGGLPVLFRAFSSKPSISRGCSSIGSSAGSSADSGADSVVGSRSASGTGFKQN